MGHGNRTKDSGGNVKIFGIGLSKTGTNSLCDALNLLGYDMLHYPPESIFDAVERCSGCADIPTAFHYKALDENFPNSKFVLTVRDRTKWLQSALKHFERRPTSTLNDWGKKMRKAVYGSEHPSAADFLRTYEKHEREVLEYFADRPDDLLILNITDATDDAATWQQLCDFLSIQDVPSVPFPHGNAAPEKSTTVDAVIPYLNEGDGWELRHAVRALCANFTDLNNLWIVGDKPDWMNDDVKVIPRPDMKASEDDVMRNFHYCKSMWMAARCEDITDDFLYLADDHYILTPRTAQNFIDTVIVRENMAAYTQADRMTASREWQLMIWDTVDKLMKSGLSGWNYETHTPKLVNRGRLMNTFATFGFGDGRLIWQTAYFNMFPPPDGTTGHLSEDTALKAGFYGETPYEAVKAKGDAAVFLNHNQDGFCDGVRRYIGERFPEPSKFEK